MEMEDLQSTTIKRAKCIHTRMIDSFYSLSDNRDELLQDNLFFKQHVKMCSICRDRITQHELFWKKKRALVSPQVLGEKQQEIFLNELNAVIDESFKSIEPEECGISKEQVRRALGQMLSTLLHAEMVKVYLVFIFLALGLKVLI